MIRVRARQNKAQLVKIMLQPMQVKRNKKIILGMSGIFTYFADLNDSYFVLQVNLAAAMEEEEEDVSYMFFFFLIGLPDLSYLTKSGLNN